MSAIGMASFGTQCTDKALGMASTGIFCDAVPVIDTIKGGVAGVYRPNKLPSFDELQKQRHHEALLREDEEVLAAIMVAISRGLI